MFKLVFCNCQLTFLIISVGLVPFYVSLKTLLSCCGLLLEVFPLIFGPLVDLRQFNFCCFVVIEFISEMFVLHLVLVCLLVVLIIFQIQFFFENRHEFQLLDSILIVTFYLLVLRLDNRKLIFHGSLFFRQDFNVFFKHIYYHTLLCHFLLFHVFLRQHALVHVHLNDHVVLQPLDFGVANINFKLLSLDREFQFVRFSCDHHQLVPQL